VFVLVDAVWGALGLLVLVFITTGLVIAPFFGSCMNYSSVHTAVGFVEVFYVS